MAAGWLVQFKQRIIQEHLFEFLIEILGGQLQQADGLLQLRCQREMLRQLELQGLFHNGL